MYVLSDAFSVLIVNKICLEPYSKTKISFGFLYLPLKCNTFITSEMKETIMKNQMQVDGIFIRSKDFS